MGNWIKGIHLIGLSVVSVVVLAGCSPELGQLGGVAKDLNGQPLGFAEIQLGRKTITTNAQGQYLFTDIPPGSYPLTVSADGFVQHQGTVEVTSGLQRLDVSLVSDPETLAAAKTAPESTGQGGAQNAVSTSTDTETGSTPTQRFTGESKIPDFKLPLPGGYDWLLSTEPGGGFYGGEPNPGHRGRSYFAMDIIDNNKQQGELNGFPVPILAAADGVVTEVRNNVICQGCQFGYGNYVKIDHGGGFMAVYAHLRYPSVTVSVGDSVRQGHVLGFMGTTGHSTGIHLHFEIRYLNEGAAQASVLNRVLVDGVTLSGYQVGTVSRPKYYHSTQELP